MNKIISICVLFFALTSAKGQYVLIPDSNFRHALISQGFASCFDSTQTMLDTTCSGVLDSMFINVIHWDIHSIEGIQYFKQLKSLACDSNPLYGLPLLPNTTSYLSCQYDSLITLPPLPTSLYLLYCFHNQLDSLPVLPNGVRWLNIANNNIVTLPALPASVYSLISPYNHIATYPTLPTGLYTLDCGNNPIIVFPVLPAALHILSCNSTGRDSLPALPNSLATLNCEYNNLLSLPVLPITLHLLNCSNNQLATLPVLPDSLFSLDCSNNLLTTTIPTLPDSMFTFSCASNPQLSCLPLLKRIVHFSFGGTALTCLPDTGNITYSSPLFNSLPLCGANGCTTTGIHEQNINDLQIYPNPVTDILYMSPSMQNATATISDISGRVVVVVSNLDNQVNVSSLQSGVYVLHIQNDERNSICKFVKE